MLGILHFHKSQFAEIIDHDAWVGQQANRMSKTVANSLQKAAVLA
jgi:hypothetical protein